MLASATKRGANRVAQQLVRPLSALSAPQSEPPFPTALIYNQSKHACKSPHECVIRVTGPLAYTSGVGAATHSPGGCRNRIRTPQQRECKDAADPLLRTMHVCEKDAGTIWNSWSCGFARHWDCRNSEQRRSCPKKHYARTKLFFDLADQGDPALERLIP